MAHAQKPDFVFPRNGWVHLNRWGRHFSRLLAAEVCASALVMLDTPRSETVWEYWLSTPFPFTSPPVRHPVPPGSERALAQMADGDSFHVWLDVLFLYITSGVVDWEFLKILIVFYIFGVLFSKPSLLWFITNRGLPVNDKFLSRSRRSKCVYGFFLERLGTTKKNIELIGLWLRFWSDIFPS